VATSLEPSAVLLTGVFGAGKSTVVADMGALLESKGEPYGLVDVDWLSWFNVGAARELNNRVTFNNLKALCAAYLDVGVRRLALAWAIRDQAQLEATRMAVGVPLTVVRLDVDEATVRARLSCDPTQERREADLRVALECVSDGDGVGLADFEVSGTSDVRQISEEICRHLGWV
jgi:hypothetical protein